jgi:hypothetical protein
MQPARTRKTADRRASMAAKQAVKEAATFSDGTGLLLPSYCDVEATPQTSRPSACAKRNSCASLTRGIKGDAQR